MFRAHVTHCGHSNLTDTQLTFVDFVDAVVQLLQSAVAVVARKPKIQEG